MEGQSEKATVAKNILKTYISGAPVCKETLLPSVAYIKDKKISDTMFDSFIFLPSPNYLYNWEPENDGKLPLNKSNWIDYIENYQFLNGKNSDALESAVGACKKSLRIPDYKVNIYLSLFYPVRSVEKFGEVGGKNLNFSNESDRLDAVKWMIDRYIVFFKKKNYSNLKLAGFYWFTEEIDKSDYSLFESSAKFIKEKGYEMIWSGYFNARGVEDAVSLGVTRAFMQPNYFPDTPSLPNAGPIERLECTADFIKRKKMGVELEFSGNEFSDIACEGFLNYLYGGVRYGYINIPNSYYINGGPQTVRELCDSHKDKSRNVYDSLYHFLKGDLKECNISVGVRRN